MKNLQRWPFAFLVCAFLVACGGSNVELPREELDRLPLESRQLVFDAENDLVIARNRQDEAVDKARDVERALDDLDVRWKRAEQRMTRNGKGSRVSNAHAVFDSNRTYLSLQLDLAKATVTTAEKSTELSQIRLDLVRRRQLVNIGRVTSESLKPLESKVSDCEKDLKALTASRADRRAKVESQLNAWKTAEDAYIRASSDYDTLTWE